MYLIGKFGGHMSYGKGDVNSYFNSYMDTLGKAKLTASAHHIERYSKLGIPIYNSKVSDTVGRKMKRIKRLRRTQAIEIRCFIKQKNDSIIII